MNRAIVLGAVALFLLACGATMPDGSTVTVTSAADERVQREKFHQAERENARATGYTVRR